MIYVKSFIVGALAIPPAVLLFEVILLAISRIRFPEGVYYDGRAIVDHFWFIALPTALVIFAVGFCWEFRRAFRTESQAQS
jgi:hypothetical protein